MRVSSLTARSVPYFIVSTCISESKNRSSGRGGRRSRWTSLLWREETMRSKGRTAVTSQRNLTREIYDAFQTQELDRWDACFENDVLVDSPAGRGLRGLDFL